MRHAEDHVDAILVDPLAHDAGADIGLVHVIADQDIGAEAFVWQIEINQRLDPTYRTARRCESSVSRPGALPEARRPSRAGRDARSA
jgi:hypothetical protein